MEPLCSLGGEAGCGSTVGKVRADQGRRSGRPLAPCPSSGPCSHVMGDSPGPGFTRPPSVTGQGTHF